jgi:cobalt-zinc-cadmium efflux system membrane fusion protein
MIRSGPPTFALLVALGACACHKAPVASEPTGPQAPPGQVWLSDQQAHDAKIEVVTIGDQDVDDTILTSGRVTFDDLRVAHIYSPVTGKVVQINAQLGERVKKGESLAVIESPDIGSAVSDLHKADADLIAAEHAYRREKDLAAKSAGTQVDLENAEDNYRKAKAEMERAQQKAYLLRQGNANSVSGTYTLSTPIDGEVITRNLNPGIEVQGQYGGNTVTELFTVGELDEVWVLADIYEMDLARVKIGSPCVVSTVAYKDKRFEGKVDWVSGMLDPTTRTAKVRCTFANKDRMLKPEMYATAQISVEQRRALAIPRNAILRLGDQTVVFVQKSDENGTVKYERMPVSVDEGESSDWLVVQHGLEAGQRIVVSGAIKLAANL